MIGTLRFAGVLLGALLAWPEPAVAPRQAVPQNDGWVTDAANLLTASQENALEARIESYRRGSGHDVALLTVPSLRGEPIEKFALRVAREWKLGGEGKNDGALLVVSRDDRQMRIEVGRGLEGTLTDATCGRIIREVITPRFQRGEFEEGLRFGVEAMQHAAGGDFAPLEDHAERPRSHGVGFFVVFLILMAAVAVLRRIGGSRYGGGGGSVWPWLFVGSALGRSSRGGWGGGWGGRGGGGGFSGFGGGGGFSGGGASGRW